MNSPAATLLREGRVEAVTGGRITLLVSLPPGCARCARGEGCGFGLATGPSERRLVLDAPPGLAAAPGDVLQLAMDEGGLTRASAAVYGIPLAALLAGASAAASLGLGDAASAAVAATSFAAGLAAARRAALALASAGRCRPRIPGSGEGAWRS